MAVADQFRSGIRDINDFPKPGIIVKNTAPLFHDSRLVTEVLQKTIGFCGGARVCFRQYARTQSEANLFLCPKPEIFPTDRPENYSLRYFKSVIEMHEAAITARLAIVYHYLMAVMRAATAAQGQPEREGSGLASFLVNLSFLSAHENLQARFGVN